MTQEEFDTCPEHGSQRITGYSSTGGPDPYGVNHLECGARVICLGPGESNIIIRTTPGTHKEEA